LRVGVYDFILQERNRLLLPPRPTILPHGEALYKYFRFSMRFIIKQIIPHVLEVFEVEGGGSTLSSSRRGTAFLFLLNPTILLVDWRCTNTSAFP
jgi:hypothetical protein